MASSKIPTIPQRNVYDKVAARESFKASALKAIADPGSWNETGRLPEGWRRRLREDEEIGISYIVYSYITPIAWVRADGVIVNPSVKYSPTTTNHQRLIGALTGPGVVRTLEQVA